MAKMYSVKKAAEKLEVSVATVRRWLSEGKIKGRQIAAKGHWKISEKEINRLLGDAGVEE